ncbi:MULTISPECIES: hypothetical protein [Crateriforma]|uniref:Uncharacterized protein n=1 Tax=Crateriforma conspicua TaxID=2527996 RepID=A0A5C5XYT5_9PLAN|nr:hypothetical protein [Crateriforma conspicua]QDV62654.1 hypothetical protein Mal65_17890 [Crateriforma conspicua]TWT68576.1 hypothetical protein Pan14r_08220 [Crateriforma conspicua]TWU61923.1 hypothetical protein V7x_36130 [Crateriforma conspicua]
MHFTRNRYFLLGVLLILLGIQFRMVESFVLNEPTTRTLAKVSQKTAAQPDYNMQSFFMQVHPKPTKRVELPRWLGMAMITVGAVVSLHAIAMPRDGS